VQDLDVGYSDLRDISSPLEESKVLREKADFATSQAPVAPDGFHNEHFVSIRINPYRHGKIWKHDETIKRLT
jgi:hypothetical protein